MDLFLEKESAKSKRYRKKSWLGEGQFAIVYSSEDLMQDGRQVAIKKVKCGTSEDLADGINRTALREIKLLRELKHDNIIGLLDVFEDDGNINLVFEFMDSDLELLIKDPNIVLTPANIKSFILQTILGLEYLHSHWIIHRDIKPNNLFISPQGLVKLGDFGLARQFGSPTRILTNQVVTRWYRSPELLFGAVNYGVGVDMWAVGCIFGELYQRAPLFHSDSDLGQLSKIFEVVGTPQKEDWPEANALPNHIDFTPRPPIPFSEIFPALTDDALELMSNLLAMNPRKRITTVQALESPYFSSPPHPTPGHLLPRPSSNGSTATTAVNVIESSSRKRRIEEVQLPVKKLCF